MKRQINCRKCGNKFETKIIHFTKTSQRCLKNEYKIIEVTKTIERPQFLKCQLCRNIAKTLDFINKKMLK
jgi:hypothetical protein